jgi:ATP-binding cassette, subfamily B, bacterial CvaB/MchF/RaxB
VSLFLNFLNRKKFKAITQDEFTECGLASLSMCFNFHNMEIDLISLRNKYPVSNDGLTMYNLIDICEEEGFIANLYEAEAKDLCQIQLPCILHWDLNHFVVLKKIKNKKYIVADPGIGEIEYTLSELENKFTGYALEVIPDFQNNYSDKLKEWNNKSKNNKLSISYFFNNSKNFHKSILYTFSIMLIIQFLSMSFPMLMQVVIDEFIVVNSSNNLIYFGAAGLGLIFFRFYASILKTWTVIYIGYKWHEHFSQHFFRKILRIPMSYFNARGSSDVFFRFSSLHKLKDALTNTIVEGLIDSLMIIFTIFAMYFYSPNLTLIVILLLLFFLVIRHILYKKEKIYTKKETLSSIKESHYFLETIRSMESVKSYAVGNERYNGWKKHYLDATNQSINKSKIKMWSNSIENLLSGIEDILVLFIGATFIISESLTLGMLFSFIAFKSICSLQSKSLINKFYELKLLGIHLERLSDIEFAEEEENVFGLPEYRNIDICGRITLENIYFKHKGAKEYLFENFSLNINSGENIVLVGKSGCGKSTLQKIMMGLLPIESGRILVDGIDIKHYGLNNFRKQIAVVSQNENLLSDSILNNISFYKKPINFEKIRECSANAMIKDHIESLNMQYESLIDEMSSTISGGQAQRILIARALYRDPKIMFLDEATSALDVETEKNIVKTLTKLGITRISIAHRETTINMADRIINLDKKT